MSKPPDLMQGTLDLLLLKILALEPMNGHAISVRLKQVSSDVLQVSDGSLYPALHKLEQHGWVTASWQVTENNRRAKFYRLTRPGRRQLEKEAANWGRISTAITRLLDLGPRLSAETEAVRGLRTLAARAAASMALPVVCAGSSIAISTTRSRITSSSRSRSWSPGAWTARTPGAPSAATSAASSKPRKTAATRGA